MSLKIVSHIVLLCLFSAHTLFAQPVATMEKEVDLAIQNFNYKIEGGEKFLSKVKGYAVFPLVTQGGLILGGKYGKGAMRVEGKTKFYLKMTSASVGLQAGVQRYSMLIAFITEASLKKFYKSSGWQTGIESAITVAQWGANRDIGFDNFDQPVVAFIFNEEGIMAGVSMRGTKFERIIPQ